MGQGMGALRDSFQARTVEPNSAMVIIRGSDRMYLLGFDSVTEERIERVISEGWSKGVQLKEERQFGDAVALKLAGTPFRAKGADAAESSQMLMSVFTELSLLDWSLEGQANISRASFAHAFFFHNPKVSHPAAVAAVQNRVVEAVSVVDAEVTAQPIEAVSAHFLVRLHANTQTRFVNAPLAVLTACEHIVSSLPDIDAPVKHWLVRPKTDHMPTLNSVLQVISTVETCCASRLEGAFPPGSHHRASLLFRCGTSDRVPSGRPPHLGIHVASSEQLIILIPETWGQDTRWLVDIVRDAVVLSWPSGLKNVAVVAGGIQFVFNGGPWATHSVGGTKASRNTLDALQTFARILRALAAEHYEVAANIDFAAKMGVADLLVFRHSPPTHASAVVETVHALTVSLHDSRDLCVQSTIGIEVPGALVSLVRHGLVLADTQTIEKEESLGPATRFALRGRPWMAERPPEPLFSSKPATAAHDAGALRVIYASVCLSAVIAILRSNGWVLYTSYNPCVRLDSGAGDGSTEEMPAGINALFFVQRVVNSG